MSTGDRQWSIGDVEEILQEGYLPPEWVYFPQDTGTGAALGVSPFTKHELHAFQFTVFRARWLEQCAAIQAGTFRNGMSDPGFAMADKWLIVAPPDVVKPDEVPPPWGLLEIRKNRTAMSTRVMIRGMLREPAAWDRPSIGKLLKLAAVTATPEGRLKDAIEGAIAEERLRVAESLRKERDRATTDYARLRATVEEYERRSGVRIVGENVAQVGDAVKLVLFEQRRHPVERFIALRKMARNIVQSIDKQLSAMEGDAQARVQSEDLPPVLGFPRSPEEDGS